MKKQLIFTALFMLMQTLFCLAASNRAAGNQDLFKEYTGRYQMAQGAQVAYMQVSVQSGQLAGKDLQSGEIKTLDHVSGDDFMLSKEKVAVKFIRDKANRVSQIAIMGQILWTKMNDVSQDINGAVPVIADYLGKYQVTANGQSLIIEITVKNNQLIATQLWDGANSALAHVSGDEFTVVALSIPLKFIRDKDKKVIQLLLNGADRFTKVKN